MAVGVLLEVQTAVFPFRSPELERVLLSGQHRVRGPESTADKSGTNLFILSHTDNKELKTNISQLKSPTPFLSKHTPPPLLNFHCKLLQK